ncbi:hypothetical protein LLH00_00310 [bacterium]|nr:hypothetical protein [bacterium]
MPNANLSPESNRGKGRGAAALLLTALLALLALACSSDKDNPLAGTLPAGFSLRGTYYLTQRSATSDGVNYTYDDQSATGGVMLVEAEDTLASASYDLYAYPFKRDYTLDGGSTSLADSGYVLRSDDHVGILYYGALSYAYVGEYDKDWDWIRFNYTQSNVLYTETWKRVKPVTDVPTGNDGVPWVP